MGQFGFVSVFIASIYPLAIDYVKKKCHLHVLIEENEGLSTKVLNNVPYEQTGFELELHALLNSDLLFHGKMIIYLGFLGSIYVNSAVRRVIFYWDSLSLSE